MEINVVARCDGTERVRFALKLIQVSLDTKRSVPRSANLLFAQLPHFGRAHTLPGISS